MKNIKNIFLPVVLTLLLGSCVKDPGSETPGPCAGEAEVELKFSTSVAYATRAVEPEYDIHDMNVLVFKGTGDAAQFQYMRTAVKKKGTDDKFTSILLVDEGLTLRFAANAGPVLAGAGEVLKKGNSWEQIREGLIMTRPQDITAAKGLPMWGEASGIDIAQKPVNILGSVPLLRSVASTELRITPTVDEFRLEEVWLVYAADTGYLPYSPDLTSGSGPNLVATGPYSPSTFRNATDIRIPGVDEGDAFVDGIYMFDNDELASSGNVNPTRIIIKGTWKKNEPGARSTYYPLAFRDGSLTGSDQKLKVTRNTKYIIQVSSVNSDGFETLDDAKRGEDVNLDYDVVAWDISGDTEIIISENKWLSLKSRNVEFPKSSGFRFRVGFSTNYFRRDMYVWDEVAGIYSDDTGNSGVVIYDDSGEPFCRVLIIKQSGTIANRYDFYFELLRDYGTSASDTATMKVRIGRIGFTMYFTQIDRDWGDWNFGGEIGWG